MKKYFIKGLVLAAVFLLIFGIATSAHEEVEAKKLGITITATNGGKVYSDGENWSALTGLEMDRGTVITLEALEHRGKFAYWKDEISNKIISDEPTYTFTLIDDVNITAFFLPDNIMANWGYVTFADINGRIYLSNYAIGNSVNEPDTSWVKNPGYDLTGWDSDEWTDVAVGDIHLIRSVYEKKDVSYTLSVTGGIAEPALSEYAYDDAVVLVADMASVPQGKVFAGWSINGELVSLDKSFGFRMACDSVAEAVYADAASEKLPVAAIIDMDTEIFEEGVSVLSIRNIPEEFELVESGILFAYGTGNDALTIDNTSATKVKALGTENKGMYRYNKTVGEGATLRAVSYIIYRFEEKLYVTYSQEKTITK